MSFKIFVLSRPSFADVEARRFLSDVGSEWRTMIEAMPAESMVEFSGRVCYMSFGSRQSNRSNIDYIANLIAQGHESVLEHVNWTLLLCGISRSFTHQLVRHRSGFAFSQLSQQYHEETDATFLEPEQIKKFPEAETIWRSAIQTARDSYREILGMLDQNKNLRTNGMSLKEWRRAVYSAARSVLPNAIETKIVVTANARSWRHFLDVRGSIVGDEEMRCICHALLSLLRTDAPALFQDFVTQTLPDGSPSVFKRPQSSKRSGELK